MSDPGPGTRFNYWCITLTEGGNDYRHADATIDGADLGRTPSQIMQAMANAGFELVSASFHRGMGMGALAADKHVLWVRRPRSTTAAPELRLLN